MIRLWHWRSRVVAAASLVVASVGVACGGVDVYQARGVVRDLHPEQRQVLIEHEEIEGLMPAMTMSFYVPDRALLDRMQVGQAIDFRLEVEAGRYRIVDFSVRGEAGAAGVSGGGFDALAGPRDPAPAFSLVDQDGGPLSLADLRGRAVVLDFVYTQCPGPCPALTTAHVRLQRALPPALRERVRFVSISIDPLHDTPEALRRYAEARGADLSDWSFLTGPPETVEPVVRAFGVGTIRQPGGEIEHTLATFLIDPEGNIAQRYLGLEHEPDEVLGDLRELL